MIWRVINKKITSHKKKHRNDYESVKARKDFLTRKSYDSQQSGNPTELVRLELTTMLFKGIYWPTAPYWTSRLSCSMVEPAASSSYPLLPIKEVMLSLQLSLVVFSSYCELCYHRTGKQVFSMDPKSDIQLYHEIPIEQIRLTVISHN